MEKNLNSRARYNFLIAVVILSLAGFACRTLVPSQASSLNLPNPTSTVVVEANSNADQTTPPSGDQNPQTLVNEEDVLINLYAKASPAVVNITALESQNNELFGFSEGSGFLFDNQGNIVTNAHVIHGADALDVTFSSGLTVPAELIGEDLSSDLAVIQVAEFPLDVIPLALGDDSTVQAGQTVVTIGNPFGFNGTMTRGIVSAIGRTIPALNTFLIPKAIQTDAPINPGNSGGPLLNLNGEVIGINAQIRTEGEDRSNSGVGFAIPVNLVKRVIPALIANGKYIWPWLGVMGGDLNWATARAMNLPVEQGAYLSRIIEDGPTDKAGLRGSNDTTTYEGRSVEIGGDVIVAVNGAPVKSFDDLLIYIAMATSPGDEVTLSIIRDGVEQQFIVKLEPRPEQLSLPTLPENLPEEP